MRDVGDYDGGKMDGFDKVAVNGTLGTYVYQYVNPAQIKPYWKVAKEYALADHMFQTEGSGSSNGHQDLIRGNTKIGRSEALIESPIGEPWGCDIPVGTVTLLLMSNGRGQQKQLLEIDGYHRRLGRLGRLVRSRGSSTARLRKPRISRDP